MGKYIRDPHTGVLYLKDPEAVIEREHQESVSLSLQALQNQINTLTARIGELETRISTGTTWQQTPAQT
jgi:tetrahydromethanopterin S-methyltransferase subunit B